MNDYLKNIQNLEQEVTHTEQKEIELSEGLPVIEFDDNNDITKTDKELSPNMSQDNDPYNMPKKVIIRKYRLKK